MPIHFNREPTIIPRTLDRLTDTYAARSPPLAPLDRQKAGPKVKSPPHLLTSSP